MKANIAQVSVERALRDVHGPSRVVIYLYSDVPQTDVYLELTPSPPRVDILITAPGKGPYATSPKNRSESQSTQRPIKFPFSHRS